MKKTTIFTALILFIGINFINAQTDVTKAQNPMDKLSFMIGEWEGSGWMMTREGKQTSKIKEKAECKLDCNIMIVEGLGTKMDSITKESVVVHNGSKIRFTVDFKTENKWIEIGEFSRDGVNWSQILGMELTRINK